MFSFALNVKVRFFAYFRAFSGRVCWWCSGNGKKTQNNAKQDEYFSKCYLIKQITVYCGINQIYKTKLNWLVYCM